MAAKNRAKISKAKQAELDAAFEKYTGTKPGWVDLNQLRLLITVIGPDTVRVRVDDEMSFRDIDRVLALADHQFDDQ